eukprot:Plantae.Rhodophyta-Hildenbrandia_rubra.ctg18372.p1 GENE.Plantae.Rhodophyta-Hildenbrandia_rubra.ctg18372~~Plantae.Rhodophyta-Hildenbrandia_rubra.ctg18372.p1  ORF type:complete len:265 (-),score=41.64 Plantae.Rhodophyta-Hildenbrandia_rubra.ctg18372:836-1630(-)
MEWKPKFPMQKFQPGFAPPVRLPILFHSHKSLCLSPLNPPSISTLPSKRLLPKCSNKSEIEYHDATSQSRDDKKDKPEELQSTKGLLLSRREVEGARHNRTIRLRRESSLGELGITDFGPESTKVDSVMIVSSYENDFKVEGRVRTEVVRVCDRCLKRYNVESRGKFEVLLCTKDERVKMLEEEFEAVEGFMGATAAVGLEPHVHDAVRLSLSTKSLCEKDCKGVKVKGGGNVGLKEVEGSDVEEKGSTILAEKLKDLRDRMAK